MLSDSSPKLARVLVRLRNSTSSSASGRACRYYSCIAIVTLFAGSEALAQPFGPHLVSGTTSTNQVPATDPSVIYGQLSSNGKVFLISPAGILVGAGGRIDARSTVTDVLGNINHTSLAARLNVRNEWERTGKIVNVGQNITPLGGSVYLVGDKVENRGITISPQGKTLLEAGATVTLQDTTAPGVNVETTGAKGTVTDLGKVTADATHIGLAGVLLRDRGPANASSAVREGGRIFLKLGATKASAATDTSSTPRASTPAAPISMAAR